MPEMPPGFELDSGLREDMILSIHSAYFAPHADYQDGKVIMLWLIGTDESDDPVEVRMSCGGGWQSDDSNHIYNPERKKQHVTKTSVYGFWLSYAFEIPELAKVLVERADSLGGAGSLDARIWLDLILQLENRELKWGKNIDAQEKLMPVAYLGMTTGQPELGEQVAPQTPSQLTQPGIPNATVDPLAVVKAARAQATQPIAGQGTVYDRAIQLAKDAPDYASFLATALSDPEILADDELAVACADQNQIWAQAH